MIKSIILEQYEIYNLHISYNIFNDYTFMRQSV